MEISRFSQDLHVKNLRLFRIKICFKIYCVQSVDQTLYLYSRSMCKQGYDWHVHPSSDIMVSLIACFHVEEKRKKHKNLLWYF